MAQQTGSTSESGWADVMLIAVACVPCILASKKVGSFYASNAFPYLFTSTTKGHRLSKLLVRPFKKYQNQKGLLWVSLKLIYPMVD